MERCAEQSHTPLPANFMFQVIFIGDSHVRYWCYYFLKQMGMLSKKLPKHNKEVQRIGKFTFQWGNFVDLLITKFKDEFKRVNNTIQNHDAKNKTKSKTLFIMNSLHWGAQHRNIAEYIKGIHGLADILNKTKKEDPEVQLLFLSGVAFPNSYNNPKINGYLKRSLNKIVRHIMRSNGIETLDLNTLLFSVNDFYVDVVHYLCIIPATGVMTGQFGPGVADLIINTICSGNKT